ncbi:sulfur carrier protein ThiS [Neobacillus drentensis]|jgi:sulfur carrier protein|uniref:sulfur carrier protein ThiS n=1 Tax=Neobacillus drentensis TaxID=220684 RepID=UPI000BF25DEA|nr:thiamine biosynthesis protein ThiS [Bacillus sp. AFS006103]
MEKFRKGEKVRVNGSIVNLEKKQTLLDFLKVQKYDFARIAVERNGEIVPKAAYMDVFLEDEDKLEIVQFVGGG